MDAPAVTAVFVIAVTRPFAAKVITGIKVSLPYVPAVVDIVV